jgi:UDP-3-O-[3-hydroxymyristoyl] N-acetylglucosamine deacetylase
MIGPRQAMNGNGHVQTTVRQECRFQGRGLHGGLTATVVVRPAPVDHGLRFRRTDLGQVIPARWDLADLSPLKTRLVNGAGASVATIEHLMAALAGLGISNALIDIDGPEVPILDGSAAPFVRGLMAAGLVQQAAPRRAIRVLRTVEVADGAAMARLSPATSLQIDFTIEFPDAAIGHSRRTMDLANGAFVRDLCDSRTFCRQADVGRMQAQGLALGGTLDNAVVVDGDRVLTPGGLRHADEPVRHKMLDALGDLALAGMPIIGRYTGVRAGHSLTNRLLRALFADPTQFVTVTCTPRMAARLPGAGVTAADLAAVA